MTTKKTKTMKISPHLTSDIVVVVTEDPKIDETKISINDSEHEWSHEFATDDEEGMTTTIQTDKSSDDSLESIIQSVKSGNGSYSEEQPTTRVTVKPETTEDPNIRLLVDSDDDEITLPPGVDIGFGSDIFTVKPVSTPKPTHTVHMIPVRPRPLPYGAMPAAPPMPHYGPILPFRSLPPPYPLPIYPITPPKVPEPPGFQTIWVPIQIERDTKSLTQMWKHMKTPNFIERGHIKNEPTLSDGTPNSWWRRPRPDYCFEPIVVQHYCSNRQPVKKWSYNEADERCYRYVDYCSADKLNSFDTLQECLISCWRARV